MFTILISDSEPDEKIKQILKELCSDMEHLLLSKEKPQTKSVSSMHCRISTAKGIYNIPHDDILFVESIQKKSVIHTTHGTLTVPIPLYRVREVLPEPFFIQTHRSFIINLKNASFIDKTKEPWIISFFNSNKTAFVSRSYRKEVLQAVTPLLDYMSD